jgi:hypothetical protein
MFVLAFTATPALAASQAAPHGDHSVVTYDSEDLTGLSVECGRKTYTVTSGTNDSVMRMKGRLDPNGIAIDPGHAIETLTLNNVRVVDQHGNAHGVVGSLRIDATWLAGADLSYYGEGPFTRYSFVEKVQVLGTRDGRSLVMRQLRDGTLDVEDSGTCTTLYI